MGLAMEKSFSEGIAPGLIVRHNNRRLGELGPAEASGRLISGQISFSEFVDQVGDGFRDLLEFMTEHDLHPGRPDDVLYCIEYHAGATEKETLRGQLAELYELRAQSGI